MMKRIILFFLSIVLPCATFHTVRAQGWPEKYDGVMLQGFYWNSYSDTNWANLEAQADELSQFFSLIWVPNSAYANDLSNNMGYHPVYWFDHKSAFGTEAQLRSMIKTFKDKGTGIIEDVVINHRASVDGNWLNFPAETYKGVTYKLTAADICKDDESKNSGYNPTGAADSGGKWDGARDLDHSSQNVQTNVQAYLDKLKNDLGYIGFRYDFVKGYAAKYVGQYNKIAQPQFSVGECWDSKTTIVNWLNGTKQDGQVMSAAFDFPMKYNINDVFASATNWSKLDNAALANDASWARYAVTFVDNHDTGPGADSPTAPLYANIEAANAFILTMPGTPCVWLRHWQTYKNAIKRLIVVRKAAGVHNQSAILSKQSTSNGYVLNVQGTKGNMLLLLGSATTSTDGYKLAVEGTNYKLYVSNGVDLSALDNIKDDSFVAPDFCVVNEGELCAFFEAPASWTTVRCWAWNGNCNFTGGNWNTATLCTKVGTNNGKSVWKWSWDGKCYKPNTATEMSRSGNPTGIIFHNGSGSQTSDLDFSNGGYYSESGALQGVVTGISEISVTQKDKASRIYTLDGRQVTSPRRGIYIVDGRKILVK